ncbi:MAG TPA: prepilin-type N-terminal cleavage/methylation domain-containing protein [Gemmatimonadales bacterium]|nr:prepilin-type N-terminal cleavage/methylation domain-containing protein [Gemmatimonadales bacterium]
MKAAPRPSWQAGFTLVEMIIVVVIIGLLATIVMPQINLARIQTKATVQSLGTTLLAVQRQAIARQHNMLVLIDAAGKDLRVVDDSNNDEQVSANERVQFIPLGQNVVFGRPAAVPAQGFGGNAINFTNTETTTGLPAIVLYRNGSAKEYGGWYISTVKAMAGVPGHANETWSMDMERATGRAEWMRWNGSTWLRGF